VPLGEPRTVTVERWVNVYDVGKTSRQYATKEEALKYRQEGSNEYVATKKIIITATEGDEE
jgi:hypothetical protein